MDEGLVRPSHLVIDTFPSEQGRQRVTAATTLYNSPFAVQKVQKLNFWGV
jgi:hypothetical protein